MKKYLSLLLACVLALALLCACGKKDAAEQTPAPETPPTQTAATGGVDTSCKLYFPNDAADDLSADTAQIPDTEPAVTVAYAQAIVAQLIAHDALPKDSEVLAISKDGDALSLDMNEAFLAGLRASGSTGEFLYMGSLVNTFLDNFNCTTVRVTVEGQPFSTGHGYCDISGSRARGCGRLEWWCLDWNRPSIDFYRSLGAQPMSDWTVYRIDGQTLQDMGRSE